MKVKRMATFLLVAMLLPIGLGGMADARATRQTFVLSQKLGDEEVRVVAGGPIHGVGVDVVLAEDRDEATGVITSEDRFQFRGDNAVFVSFQVVLTSEFTVDPRTCVGRETGTLTWHITGGTGRYSGARGDGTGAFRVTAVEGRNPDGSCSMEREDERAYVFMAHLSGVATVPGATVA